MFCNLFLISQLVLFDEPKCLISYDMNNLLQVELERVRLLCERIIKREKVKVRHFQSCVHGFDVCLVCIIGSMVFTCLQP